MDRPGRDGGVPARYASRVTSTAGTTQGAQTLARGLAALRAVAETPDGLGPNDLASRLGVHRSIAYRILQTLVEAGFVVRGADGRYRGAVGLLALAAGGYMGLRDAAVPVMRRAAEDLGATVSLLVVQGTEASALAVVNSARSRYRIVFAEGSTHPLDRGAAGHVLRAFDPPRPDDTDAVRLARAQGWSSTFAEVEPGAYGLAVPVLLDGGPNACLNVITYVAEVADLALDRLIEAAAEISALPR